MTELSSWNFDHFKNISAEIENISEIVENNEVVKYSLLRIHSN